jgi:hypothetical protein
MPGPVPRSARRRNFPMGRRRHDLTRANHRRRPVSLILHPAGVRGPRERRFVDASGIAWCVREKATLGRRPALYFESVGTFRRVTQYPRDWHDLPTGELEILSHGT